MLDPDPAFLVTALYSTSAIRSKFSYILHNTILGTKFFIRNIERSSPKAEVSCFCNIGKIQNKHSCFHQRQPVQSSSIIETISNKKSPPVYFLSETIIQAVSCTQVNVEVDNCLPEGSTDFSDSAPPPATEDQHCRTSLIF